MLCVFAEQAGERASDHQGHAAEGQTDGGQPVHAGLRQGMCVLHSGQSGVGRQNGGIRRCIRLCVLHGRQLGGAGQYGRVGILFFNDLVVAVVTAAVVVAVGGDDGDLIVTGQVAVAGLHRGVGVLDVGTLFLGLALGGIGNKGVLDGPVNEAHKAVLAGNGGGRCDGGRLVVGVVVRAVAVGTRCSGVVIAAVVLHLRVGGLVAAGHTFVIFSGGSGSGGILYLLIGVGQILVGLIQRLFDAGKGGRAVEGLDRKSVV